MRKSSPNPWFGIGVDAWTMGMDAASVIGMRCIKIAMGGPAGDAEAKLMINEKIKAALHVQTALLTGKLGTSPAGATTKALRHYSAKVRANRDRLSKG